MKKKTSKILIGILSTLCIIGATSTVVGALSDGFKNWDTSTWFDRNQKVEISTDQVVTETDESSPVKLKIEYLNDGVNSTEVTRSSVKKTQFTNTMTGIKVTATLDSQYGEATKYNFSVDRTTYVSYETSPEGNSIILNFTKRSDIIYKISCSCSTSSGVYRGSATIKFLAEFSPNIRTTKDKLDSEWDLFRITSDGGALFIDYQSKRANDNILLDLIDTSTGYFDSTASIALEIVDNKVDIDWISMFNFSFRPYVGQYTCDKCVVNIDKDIIDNILLNVTEPGFVLLGTLQVKCSVYSYIKTYDIKVYLENVTFNDNGIEMDDTIILPEGAPLPEDSGDSTENPSRDPNGSSN